MTKATKTVVELKGPEEGDESSFVLLDGDLSHLDGRIVEFFFAATEEEWEGRSEQHKAIYHDEDGLPTFDDYLSEEQVKAEREAGAAFIQLTVME